MLKIGFTREEKRTAICSAIRQLHTLEFYYHGGYRTVEPFALGIVIPGDADNESLICYQTGGYSEMLEVVGWKLYRESEIEDIVILKDEFTGERPNYDSDNIGMWQVICCVRPRKRQPVIEEPTVLTIESMPIPPSAPPLAPALPTVRYLTHNEVMDRFRFAHPVPIPALYTALRPEPLAIPFSDLAESETWPDPRVAGVTHYLVGQPSLTDIINAAVRKSC